MFQKRNVASIFVIEHE